MSSINEVNVGGALYDVSDKKVAPTLTSLVASEDLPNGYIFIYNNNLYSLNKNILEGATISLNNDVTFIKSLGVYLSGYKSSPVTLSIGDVSNEVTVHKYGNKCYMSVILTNFTPSTNSIDIGTLPTGFRPIKDIVITSYGKNNGNSFISDYYIVPITIKSNGVINITLNNTALQNVKYFRIEAINWEV